MTPKQKKIATWALVATFVVPLVVSFLSALFGGIFIPV